LPDHLRQVVVLEGDAAVPQRPYQVFDLGGDERDGRGRVGPGVRRAVDEKRGPSRLERHHFLVLHDLGQPERALVELLRRLEVLDPDSRNRIVIAEHTVAPFEWMTGTTASNDPPDVTQPRQPGLPGRSASPRFLDGGDVNLP